MTVGDPTAVRDEFAEADHVARAVRGDQAAFAVLTERYRAELRLHCYRFTGSLHDAEDLVQDTLLRAWHKRSSYAGRSTFRAWLYGIATNACLDALRGRRRRVLPPEVAAPADPLRRPAPPADLPWLEPYPDRLLDQVDAPESRLLAKESTELAFLAAIQHLPPRQRAVLILRDVLDWSARETADVLHTTPAAVHSALQRAHQTLRRHWTPDARPAAVATADRDLVRRLVDAWERTDVDALTDLLSADARLVMPPTPSWYDGVPAIRDFFTTYAFRPQRQGAYRVLPTAANRQPAVAVYVRRDDGTGFEPFAVVVLAVHAGRITGLTLFRRPDLFAACGLPDAP